MNRTDVETLCPSFGSFARIAQADAAQLARLPEFGLKTVTRPKAAFEPLVRTARRATLPATSGAAFASPPLLSQHLHPLSPCDGVSRRMGADADAAPPLAAAVDRVLVAAAATTRAFRAE
ncbi:hypothetical protein EDB85DRAFT_1160237 [Lactarius pseudohatsudake]|nr:hypothetical protein EDB85DRAFT_1160237 [Lactarius pseudohatsudake]